MFVFVIVIVVVLLLLLMMISDVVDIKPPSIEELAEIITCCVTHPTDDSLFCYSTSRGILNLVDTRVRALCDSVNSNVSISSSNGSVNNSVSNNNSNNSSSSSTTSTNGKNLELIGGSVGNSGGSKAVTSLLESDAAINKSYFSEIVTSVSDVK